MKSVIRAAENCPNLTSSLRFWENVDPARSAARFQPGFSSSPPTTFDGRGIEPGPWSLTMLDPRALTHAQLAEIVADVQAILWQESRMRPDDPRQYGDYWNPGKEDDGEGLEQIADILADADLKPPDYMPVAKPVGPAEIAARAVVGCKDPVWLGPCSSQRHSLDAGEGQGRPRHLGKLRRHPRFRSTRTALDDRSNALTPSPPKRPRSLSEASTPRCKGVRRVRT
jgi:hypothetical protein